MSESEFDEIRTEAEEIDEEEIREDEEEESPPPGIYLGLDEVGLPRYYNGPGWGLHRW